MTASASNGVGAEAWRTFRLAVPIVLTELSVIAVNTTDVVMMGRLGAETLAAGAIALRIFLPTYLLCLGFALAVTPMAAQAVGRGDQRGAALALRHGLLLTLASAAPAAVVVWHGSDIALLFGQDPALCALAEDYLRLLALSLLPNLWFVTLRSFLGANDMAVPGLAAMLGAVAVNAAVNYALMFGNLGMPDMGLAGAGVGSIAAFSFAFLSLAAYVLLGPAARHVASLAEAWRPERSGLRETADIGLPLGLAISAEHACRSAGVFLMGAIGVSALAGYSVAMQLVSVGFMVMIGLGHAATVRVGLAAGASDSARVLSAGLSAVAMGACIMALSGILCWTFGDALAAFFIAGGDSLGERSAPAAVGFLALAGVFGVLEGVQVVAMSALRGLRDSRTPLWMSLACHWGLGLGLSAFLVLVLGWSGTGVWVGMIAGSAVLSILMVRRFLVLGGATGAPREPLSATVEAAT